MPEIIVNRKNIKKMYLRVRDGKIFVSAPLWASQSKINSFIISNKKWIRSQLIKASTSRPDTISILEHSYSIVYTEELCYRVDQDIIYLNQDRYREELRKLILERSSAYFEQRFRYYCQLMGYQDLRFQLKFYTSKWGSFHWKTNTVRLNAFLALTDKECIDAILIHELCHVKHHDHSSNFYSDVLKWMPRYKEVHRRLNAFQIPKI